MHRLSSLAIATAIVTLAGLPAPATADTTQLGVWFGPRVFSDDSRLGYVPDAPVHLVLDNAIEFGVRVGRPFLPWLVPELELAMAPTGTNKFQGVETDVFWLEPRLHLRLELTPTKRILPFLVIGGGSPIALSAARKTFDSGILGEGYVGGGVRVDTLKGFGIRVDARVSFLPGIDSRVTSEIDIGIGLVFDLGRFKKKTAGVVAVSSATLDGDGDGVPDASDKCPDRLEDKDGFDDLDGCPDIDNDLDGVLDIADKCPSVPETYNGFEDDNGCPDVVPPDVDALRGTIEGLIYADGETAVRNSAAAGLAKIVKVMQAHPSIRVVLIGHTDSEEAKQFATKPAPGEPAVDIAALAADLSRARAEAVKQAFAPLGIPPGRIEIEARGSEEPVAENDKPRGRLANRRVEIKLFVPIRSKK